MKIEEQIKHKNTKDEVPSNGKDDTLFIGVNGCTRYISIKEFKAHRSHKKRLKQRLWVLSQRMC